jgi:uncharacterized membrane protein
MKAAYGMFLLKCVLTGGLMMFLSMLAGELIFKPDMFGRLFERPSVWPWIFAESAVWLLPFVLVGFLFLLKFQKLPSQKFAALASLVWFLMGAVIVLMYKVFFFPKEWDLLARLPEVFFGWILPCILIWIFFTVFSVRLFRSRELLPSQKLP